MAKVALPLTGGCQCGTVRYELTDAPLCCMACHCTQCQRISGSAFAVNIVALAPSLRITHGEFAVVEWAAESGNVRLGYFCPRCGSRIMNGYPEPNPAVSVRTGTFDDQSWVRPVGHIWTAHAQPWVTFDSSDLTFEKGPDDMAPLFQRFAELDLFET